MVVGEVVAHLCRTLIIKELEFSVEHDRVVTTLNTIKHEISYLVYFFQLFNAYVFSFLRSIHHFLHETHSRDLAS
jgi:hypothetical protein